MHDGSSQRKDVADVPLFSTVRVADARICVSIVATLAHSLYYIVHVQGAPKSSQPRDNPIFCISERIRYPIAIFLGGYRCFS